MSAKKIKKPARFIVIRCSIGRSVGVPVRFCKAVSPYYGRFEPVNSFKKPFTSVPSYTEKEIKSHIREAKEGDIERGVRWRYDLHKMEMALCFSGSRISIGSPKRSRLSHE